VLHEVSSAGSVSDEPHDGQWLDWVVIGSSSNWTNWYRSLKAFWRAERHGPR
jgi:hypothetical protein